MKQIFAWTEPKTPAVGCVQFVQVFAGDSQRRLTIRDRDGKQSSITLNAVDMQHLLQDLGGV